MYETVISMCNVQSKAIGALCQKSANDDFATVRDCYIWEPICIGIHAGLCFHRWLNWFFVYLWIVSLYFPVLGSNLILALNLTQDPNNRTAKMEKAQNLKFAAVLFQPFYFPHPVAVSLFPAFFGWESICSFKWFGSGCLDSCTVAPSKTVINVYSTLNTSIIAIRLNPYWLLYYS